MTILHGPEPRTGQRNSKWWYLYENGDVPILWQSGSDPITLGRPVLNIGVIKVCDALRLYRSVSVAAEKLGCSRAFIYKVLKAEGLIAKEMIKR
jgi:hypothetical protein